jgi:hypothetical protein
MNIIAGILLVTANVMFAMGYAYKSLFLFLAANVAFLINAVTQDSIFGAASILLGIIAQLYVMIKMYKGEYKKNLHKTKGD